MDGCRIGVGRVEITPARKGPTGGWGIGFGTLLAKPPTDPAEKLHATAIALEDADGRRVVFVNGDLQCGSRPVWEAVAAGAGLDRSQLVLCGSHTHGGPGQPYGGWLFALGATLPLGLSRHRNRLIERIGRAVDEAVAGLSAGGATVVRGLVDGVGNNRATPAWSHYPSEVIDDFVTNGPGRHLADEPRKAARYRDPRLTLLVARSDDGRQRGALAWYGVHPNSLGPAWSTFSADLYGWARHHVETTDGTIVGFGGGSAGDVSPQTLDDDGHVLPPFETAADAQGADLASGLGRRVGDTVVGLLAAAEPEPFTLSVAHEDWRADEVLPSPIYGMTQLGAGVDGPTKLWPELEAGIHSPRVKEMERRRFPPGDPQHPKTPWFNGVKLPLTARRVFDWGIPGSFPLHVIRVADHVFATVPGEPTVMNGWRIEQAMIAATGSADGADTDNITASVIGYAGDYCGYWVTPEEYLEQRYEAGSTVFGREAATELRKALERLAASID